MINRRLTWILEKRGILPKHQAGFRKGYSTIDHIIRLETAAKSALNSGNICSAVFLDLTKAYDETWITGLLFKLTKIGIKGKLLRWLRSFLTDRTAQVTVEGCISEERTLTKGVPQGGILSPTLFCIMMYDFPGTDEGVVISTYADDITIDVTAHSTIEAETKLQRFLNRVERWADEWKLTFSVNKCASLTFSRRNREEAPVRLFLKEQQIGTTEEFKFLGVWFNRRLTWKTHIDRLASSTLRSGHLMKTLTSKRNGISFPLLIRTYKALIRSRMDYGAAVLAGALPSHFNKLEIVQNNILRMILGAFKSTPRSLLYLETGIPPVVTRWKYLAAIYMTKLSRKPANPAYEEIHMMKKEGAEWDRLLTPAAVSTLEELGELTSISFDNPPMELNWSCTLAPWDRPPVEYKFFPMSKKAAMKNPGKAVTVFQELTSEQQDGHIMVFTDGSVDESKCTAACSVYIPKEDISKSWRLEKHTSILTAELTAIKHALILVTQLDGERCTVFTDSASAIQCLQKPEIENELVDGIYQLIKHCLAGGTRCTFTWIPSHTGIPGNEVADDLAREGRQNPTEGTIKNSSTVQELIVLYKEKWRKKLVRTLKGSSTNPAVTAREKFGPLPWHTHENRNILTVMFRLRSRHNKLRKCLGSWDPEGDVFCRNGCQEEEDAEHVILNCPEYSAQRIRLLSALTRVKAPLTAPSILGLNTELPKRYQLKIRDALCRFLTDADLLDSI